MPVKQKTPGVFMFAGKCYLSTPLTKRGGYCLHAFGGNVIVQQEALSLLPRLSQEKTTSSMKLCREVGHSSSRASTVIWHVVSPPPTDEKLQLWLCVFYYLFPRDCDCPVVWWKGCCVQKEYMMFWDKLAVRSSFLLLHWEQVLLTSYYVLHCSSFILAFC